MWVIFLSLLACNPSKNLEDDIGLDGGDAPEVPLVEGPAGRRIATNVVPITQKPVQKRRMSASPSGEVIRSNCYGRKGGNRRMSMKPRAAMRPASGIGSPPPPPMAPSPALSSRPKAKPTRERSASLADGEGFGGLVGAAAVSAPSDLAASAPEPEAAERRAPQMKESKEVMAMEEADEWSQPYQPPLKPTEPVMDWGATVFLSNDDSMSLASAQRVLWAVDRGASFSASEVRPHELLNYFSFDTSPVASGETFSVLGGAERNDDTLSVALAVQGMMPERQPLDLTLVIDRSGSMGADGRMDYVRRGLLKMTEQLVDGDRVDLVLFDSSVCTPLENFVVGRDAPELLTEELQRIRPRGSTDLDGGLREGYRIQASRDKAETHKRNQRVLLLTDANLNSGNVNEALVSEIGKRFEEDGVRVTGVGVGRNFNDRMLNKITEKGKGAYVYLGSEAVVDRVFGAGFDSLIQTIAHDVQFAIELPDSLAMERFYGEESSTHAEDVQPINYYAGTSQLFLQDLKVNASKMKPSDTLTFRAKFRDARTGEPQESAFTTTIGALLDGDTHNLKKAQALMKWTDLLLERAMGDRSCRSLWAYRRAAGRVEGDAEIAYVSSLTGKMCGVDVQGGDRERGVDYKVRIDADQAISQVELSCSSNQWRERRTVSGNIARFEDVPSGSCRLSLRGGVPMVTSVEVPSIGGDTRCVVRGGRMRCDG